MFLLSHRGDVLYPFSITGAKVDVRPGVLIPILFTIRQVELSIQQLHLFSERQRRHETRKAFTYTSLYMREVRTVTRRHRRRISHTRTKTRLCKLTRAATVLAPVVRRLDNAIQWVSVNKTNYTIRWKVIYPVDSVIHLLNNPALEFYTVERLTYYSCQWLIHAKALPPSLLTQSSDRWYHQIHLSSKRTRNTIHHEQTWNTTIKDKLSGNPSAAGSDRWLSLTTTFVLIEEVVVCVLFDAHLVCKIVVNICRIWMHRAIITNVGLWS